MAKNSAKFISLVIVLVFNAFRGLNAIQDSAELKRYCPKLCKCDVYEGLRRADCSNQRLINAATGVPDEVEILDLGRNEIESIDDHAFEQYSNIVDLSLTYNAISTISFHAFEHMKHLRQLDLSYNRLEAFDYKIFETNHKLQALDLSGNKFVSLENQPIVSSVSLEILRLRDCKLPHVQEFTFSAVPNLKELDLSQNILQVIYSKTFVNVKKLQKIQLEDNAWNCNRNMEVVLRWFRKRGIHVEKNQCFKQKGKTHFEKVIDATTETPRMDVKIELVWNVTQNYFTTILENITGKPTEIEKINSNPYNSILGQSCATDIDELNNDCTAFEICKSNLTDLYKAHEMLLKQVEIYKANHQAALISMCYIGLFFGGILGAAVMFLICCLKNLNIKKSFEEPLERQRLRQAYKDRSRYAHAESVALSQDQAEGSGTARLTSSIAPERVPSFRNSIEATTPRSLSSLRPVVRQNSNSQRLYSRRQQENRRRSEDDMPTILRYFRRQPRPQRLSVRTSQQTQANTYFLPSPTRTSPSARISCPTETLLPQRQLSTAVSSASVIYNEIDEASQISPGVCCAEHIRRQVDAMTVDLLKEANAQRNTITPPPPYIDCMNKPRKSVEQ